MVYRVSVLFGAACCLLMMSATATVQAAVIVPVGNFSFETVGAGSSPPTWYELPNPGAWVDGNPGAIFDILNVPNDTTHFPTTSAPEGNNVLNLGASSPMTQDLSYAIDAGDIIELQFYLGTSNTSGSFGGNVNIGFTLDSVDVFTDTVINDASPGTFSGPKTVQWTATSGGNLGLKISNGGFVFIDAVTVEVTPIPEPASLILLGVGSVLIAGRRLR